MLEKAEVCSNVVKRRKNRRFPGIFEGLRPPGRLLRVLGRPPGDSQSLAGPQSAAEEAEGDLEEGLSDLEVSFSELSRAGWPR